MAMTTTKIITKTTTATTCLVCVRQLSFLSVAVTGWAACYKKIVQNTQTANTKKKKKTNKKKQRLLEGKRPLVIVGPSGVGKGTLVRKLFREYPKEFSYCISHTTRKPRKGEKDGEAYYFVSWEKIKQDIESGVFVEHAVFAGNMYGTSFRALNDVAASGKVPVLELDMQGAIQLHENPCITPTFCFIKPPSYEELANRLKGRGTESQDKVQRRLNQAKEELEFIESPAGSFFHIVFVNNDLEKSYKHFTDRLLVYYPHLLTK